MTDIIRIDANFLERGLFALDRQYSERSFSSADGKYEIICSASSVPVDVDHAVLIYLLHASQNSVGEDGEWERVMSPSFLDILKGVGKKRPGKADYRRVKESLYRYSTARIEFRNSFYEKSDDGDNHVSKSFSILSYEIDEDTGRPVIALDEIFLRQLRRTKFYKNLSFSEYRRLTQPLARRLFELLEKWTMSQKSWTIDAKRLGRTLHMAERAASQIIKRVKAALVKVNKATGDRYGLNITKVRHGVFTLKFTLEGKRFSVKDELAKKNQPYTPAAKPETKPTPKPSTPKRTMDKMAPVTLPAAVLEALPELEHDAKLAERLAELTAEEAVALINYSKAKATGPSGATGYLIGVCKNRSLTGLKTLAAEQMKVDVISTIKATFTSVELRVFRYARIQETEEDIRTFLAKYETTYERFREWEKLFEAAK